MNRLGIYQTIINNLEDTYKRKNSDYGNSVGDTYEKFVFIVPISIITRNFSANIQTISHTTKHFANFLHKRKGSDSYLPLPLNQFQTIMMKESY